MLSKSEFMEVFLIIVVAVLGSVGLHAGIQQYYYSLGTSQVTITNQGTLGTVSGQVYWDVTCAGHCTSIDWGTLKPGESKTITLYVRNEGSDPISATIQASAWVPTDAVNHMNITWDWSANLDPNRIRTVHLILLVKSDIHDITNFNFQIVITFTG